LFVFFRSYGTMKNTPVWEDVLLIVAILMLWPEILRKPPLISNMSLLFALFITIIILIKRIKRFQAYHYKKNETKKTTRH